MIIALLLLILFALAFTAFVLIFAKRNKEEEVDVYEDIRNPLVMQILVPRENDKSALAAEQMFASIHGILGDSKKSLDLISFEVISSGEDGIRFFVVTPGHLAKFIEGQIYAQYPNADITYEKDYSLNNSEAGEEVYITSGEVEMEKDSIFPIKTFRNFEVDPLAAITGAMSEMGKGERAWLQIIVRPVSNYWQKKSKEYISAIREGKDMGGFNLFAKLASLISTIGKNLSYSDSQAAKKEVVKLEPGQEEELSEIETKMLKLGFEVRIRIVTKATTQ